MSNLVISGAGAAVGYLVGGPTGAQIGWLAGSYLSADAPKIAQTNQIGDLRVQTSQYGTPIPFVYGKQRVSGNVIWAKEKTTYEITQQSSGKGGSESVSVGTGYKVSMAIALCVGPIITISRVWGDGKLLIDTRTTAGPLIGTLYTGTLDQLPDPTMESYLGAGNVPAYRGIAYIVLNEFDLGITGRIPNFTFEIVKAIA